MDLTKVGSSLDDEFPCNEGEVKDEQETGRAEGKSYRKLRNSFYLDVANGSMDNQHDDKLLGQEEEVDDSGGSQAERTVKGDRSRCELSETKKTKKKKLKTVKSQSLDRVAQYSAKQDRCKVKLIESRNEREQEEESGQQTQDAILSNEAS